MSSKIRKKIVIVGAGYVGFSLSVLLSQHHEILLIDIDEEKVNLINKKKSPIRDEDIDDFLIKKDLDLSAKTKFKDAYREVDFVIIATPTNYDSLNESFDTNTVEKTIRDILSQNNNANIVIKSTVPLGFTDSMRKKFNSSNIFFSPEFLREGKALYDNLYPSRIVIGDTSEKAVTFGKILLNGSMLAKDSVNIHYITSKEAEAVKLFSNSYLAMRIAFFNELDSFAEVHDLSTSNIIKAVSDDPRIGNYYNNPSFAYGGYCLPKDTKQLLNNYNTVPNELIKSIIESNKTRKKFIARTIINKSPKSIGVFHLSMKTNSDNFRESAVLDLIKMFQRENIEINLYEPLIKKIDLENINIINDFEKFVLKSDIIIANRMSEELYQVRHKVYTRDIFGIN